MNWVGLTLSDTVLCCRCYVVGLKDVELAVRTRRGVCCRVAQEAVWHLAEAPDPFRAPQLAK